MHAPKPTLQCRRHSTLHKLILHRISFNYFKYSSPFHLFIHLSCFPPPPPGCAQFPSAYAGRRCMKNHAWVSSKTRNMKRDIGLFTQTIWLTGCLISGEIRITPVRLSSIPLMEQVRYWLQWGLAVNGNNNWRGNKAKLLRPWRMHNGRVPQLEAFYIVAHAHPKPHHPGLFACDYTRNHIRDILHDKRHENTFNPYNWVNAFFKEGYQCFCTNETHPKRNSCDKVDPVATVFGNVWDCKL